ncbi:MAG: EthD family reductase [Acidimicrobiales bacterium]
MIKLTVLYGNPTDPEAFDHHYRTTHAPLASKIPDLARFEATRVTGTADGSQAPYHLIADLLFENMEKFQAAMGSAEGQAAAGDVANFATGGATLLISETLD